MLQPSVENFHNTAQLGMPSSLHLVEAGIHVAAEIVDSRVYIAQAELLIKIPISTVSIVATDAKAIDKIWPGLISLLPIQS